MGDTVKPFARHCRNSLRYEGCLWAGGPARDDPPAVGIAVSHNGSGTTASSHPFLIEAASVPRAFWSGADAGFSASLRSPGNLPRGEFCVGTEPHIDADHDRGRGFHRRRALFRARGADPDHARVPAHAFCSARLSNGCGVSGWGGFRQSSWPLFSRWRLCLESAARSAPRSRNSPRISRNTKRQSEEDRGDPRHDIDTTR